MLTQPAYIGSIASQKSICAFKLGWMGYHPQEEWITVENTHEPLVDIETWDIVQKKIKERKRPGASGEWSIFAGLLKCSTGGKTMTARYNSKREKHYSCLTYNRYGKDHCTQHRTRDTLIYDTVLKEIQTLAKLAFKDKDKAIIKILSQTKSKSKTDNVNMEKQFKAATKRKKELEQMINKIYQDWVAGVLTEENFKRILQQCQEEQKKQDDIISEYTTVIEEKEQTLSATQNAISILDKYTDIKELSAIILNELIEKIVIGEVEKVDGKPVQTMEIYFRFPYIATMKIR